MSTGPVFIIGAPRSGTTLLQYMLRSHPRLSFPTGESHFMVPVYRKAATYGNLRIPGNMRNLLEDIYSRNPGFIDDELHGLKYDMDILVDRFIADGSETVPSVISGIMQINANGEGKVRWGDKTPYYSLHIPLIMEMFPNAQIIHIIRDGRDCALSMLERGKDLDIHNIYAAAMVWKQYVSAGQEAGSKLDAKAYYEIHYENLLLDTTSIIKGICNYLDEEFSESVITFTKPRKKGKTPLLTKPVQSDNKEKWRTRMTQWQLKVFESVAGDVLERNGYVLATKKSDLKSWIKYPYIINQRYNSRIAKKFRFHKKI